MPTTSSMDLQVPYFTLGYDFSNENIVCTGKTPFDRVYAPTGNQPHVQITGENAVWFENEINGILSVQPGGLGNSNLQISGSSNVCSQDIYGISSLPIGSTVTWSSSNSYLATVSTSANVATLTRVANNGTVALVANISTPCGNVTLSKSIHIGADDIPIGGMITNASYGVGQYITLSAGGDYINANNYSWSVYGASIISGQGSNTITILTNQNTSTVPLYLDISLVINVSGCGDAYGAAHAFVASDGLPNPERTSIYPNPANNEINVQYISEDSDKTTIYSEITLLNHMGKVVSAIKQNKAAKITIDISKIPNGNYFLHLKNGKEITKKQIIIQH